MQQSKTEVTFNKVKYQKLKYDQLTRQRSRLLTRYCPLLDDSKLQGLDNIFHIPHAPVMFPYLFSASNLSILFQSLFTRASCSCSKAFSKSTFSLLNYITKNHNGLSTNAWNTNYNVHIGNIIRKSSQC